MKNYDERLYPIKEISVISDWLYEVYLGEVDSGMVSGTLKKISPGDSGYDNLYPV